MEKFLFHIEKIRIPEGVSVDFLKREINPCYRLHTIKPIILSTENYVVGNYDSYILAIARRESLVFCIRQSKPSLVFEHNLKHDRYILSAPNLKPQNRNSRSSIIRRGTINRAKKL